MNNDYRFRMVAGALICALVLSLVANAAALAQDASPTSTLEGSATETQPATNAAATETPTSEASATDEATATETPSLESTATETETLVSETLSATPTETQTETPTTTPTPHGPPLQAAAFTTGDVIWCPATVKAPQEGGGMGCIGPETSLAALATAMTAAPAVDGKIWIGSGYTDTTNVVFDGTSLTTIASKKLTIVGGWDTANAGTISTSTPSQILHIIDIGSWGNEIAMSDLEIDGSSTDNLRISTTGKITLLRIRSEFAATGSGAELINTAGTADVFVTDSWFNHNSSEYGLYVSSNGSVALNNVESLANAMGLFVVAGGMPSKNVTITASEANANTGGRGLEVVTTGNVSISQTTASGNTTQDGALVNSTGGGAVTISSSEFKTNNGDGLRITSVGVVTLANVTASENSGGDGAEITNDTGAVKNVMLTGANEFNANRQSGLVIQSKGLVSLNDVTALLNGHLATAGDGVNISNIFGPNPGMGVTLTGSNYISGNDTHGLIINSYGPVKANNVLANSNSDGVGMYVTNFAANSPQPVSLTGTNQFSYNEGGGLNISSDGVISLSNVTANGTEFGDGVHLDNLGGPGSAINLTGFNTMLENWENGLEIYSVGAITVNNITADDNGQSGSGEGARLSNATATTPKSISVLGTNSLNNNEYSNLVLLSYGAITVNSVTANGSLQGSGVHINNQYTSSDSKQPVSITGTNIANENADTGFKIFSYGIISASNLTANENGAVSGDKTGAYFSNIAASSPMGATVSGVNTFNDNFFDGLKINADGAVKVNSVTANVNTVHGVSIVNTGGTTGSVTITGVNNFDGNGSAGIDVDSTGTITAANLNADSTAGGVGINLGNHFSGSAAPKNVSVSGVNSAVGNFSHGISITSLGEIAISNVTASGNGTSMTNGHGLGLDNLTGAVTAKKVTVSGTNVLNDNYQTGLIAVSLGTISASNLTANGNDDAGVSLSNSMGANGVGITVSGTNSFVGNVGFGINIVTNGPVTTNNLTARNTFGVGSLGASISNHSGATSPQKVTLTGVNTFTGNNGGGINVTSRGAVSVNALTSTGNLTNYGVIINNANGPDNLPQAVVLTGSNTVSNNSSGVSILTYGPVTISAITASNNTGGYGLSISNTSAALPQNVTISGPSTFSNNGGAGLEVFTAGAITTKGLTANQNNPGNGVFLSNANGTSTAALTLSGNNVANGNSLSGFVLNSFGVITTSNLTANANGIISSDGNGASISNSSAATPKDVKLNGTNSLVGNYDENLVVTSHGAIAWNNLTASSSVTTYGASIYNDTEGKGVTFTGNNYFNSNDDLGLLVNTSGPILGNNLNASLNGADAVAPDSDDDGAQLNNTSATTPRSVTLKGTNVFIDNQGVGLNVTSDGAILINNLRAHFNDQGGGYLNNSTGTAPVTLTGVNAFRSNTGNAGLRVNSTRAVTLNKLTADDNAFQGLHVTTTPGIITLMCATFSNNTGVGAEIGSTTLYKFTGVVAAGNANPQIDFTAGANVINVRACPLK